MSNPILITDTEVISKAYITIVDKSFIKIEIINVAQHTYIKPVLGITLFEDVLQNPSNYTTLINDYISPCLAFFIKYLLYSQQIFASAEYSNPDPTQADTFVSPEIAANIDTNLHYMAINDILFIARQKEQILIDYLKANPPALFEPPSKKIISGFLLQGSP